MLSEIIAPMSSHIGPVNLWTRSTALLIVSLRSFMSLPHSLMPISATHRTTACDSSYLPVTRAPYTNWGGPSKLS